MAGENTINFPSGNAGLTVTAELVLAGGTSIAKTVSLTYNATIRRYQNASDLLPLAAGVYEVTAWSAEYNDPIGGPELFAWDGAAETTLATLQSTATNAYDAANSADGKLPSDTTTKLGRLDATVSSRMSTFTVPASFSTADFTRLDAAVSTRMATFSYTAPLDAAGTRSALGMTSANFDTQLGAVLTSSAFDTKVPNILPTFVHTAGKLWVLDGSGNAVANQATAQSAANVSSNLYDLLDPLVAAGAFTEDALANAPVAEGASDELDFEMNTIQGE